MSNLTMRVPGLSSPLTPFSRKTSTKFGQGAARRQSEPFALHGRAGVQPGHFSLFLKELRLRPTLGARRLHQSPKECFKALALSKDCGEGRVLTIWAGDKNDSRVQPILEKTRIDAATRT